MIDPAIPDHVRLPGGDSEIAADRGRSASTASSFAIVLAASNRRISGFIMPDN
jgi:hypothetical protein